MCVRKVDPTTGKQEPLILYWVKNLAEMLYDKPASFVAIISCIGMYYLYKDMQETNEKSRIEYRDFMKEQTQTLIKLAEQLSEMNVRISNIENHRTAQ